MLLDVKVGDRILFGKYSGSEITLGEEEYIIMREDEVLASLSGGNASVDAELSDLPGDSETEMAGDPETRVQT